MRAQLEEVHSSSLSRSFYEEAEEDPGDARAMQYSEKLNCMIGGSLETIDEKSKSELYTMSEMQSEVSLSKEEPSLRLSQSQDVIKCFMCSSYMLKKDASKHLQEC